MPRVADWSLAASRGFSLFPLSHHSKRPAEDWESYQQIPAPPAKIAEWSAQPFNTGVATGAVSGVVVLDCDSLMARIEAESRGTPATLTVATPRGTHFYFQHPGHHVPNRAGKGWTTYLGGPPVDGWDIRGDGGYVVGPGSWYEATADEVTKGKMSGAYEIEVDAPVAPMPDWLAALLAPREHKPAISARFSDTTTVYGQKCLSSEVAILENTPSGAVNAQINASAFAIGQLVAGGEIEASEALEALTNALAVLGVEHEEKATGTLERGYAAGLEAPRGVEHDVPRPPLDIRAVLGVRTVPDDFIPPAPPVRLTARSLVPEIKPRYVNASNMHDYFDGCVYVAKDDQMFLPSGVMVGKSAFDALYGGPGFVSDFEGEGKPIKSAWEMFRQNEHCDLPKVWRVCFKPLLAPGQILDLEGLPSLNTYVPVTVPRTAGDASPFVEHVRRLLPHGGDADSLLHWMASCVQNPGAKFQWWPVIQGTKGGGKTLLLEVMINAVGERYSHLVRADSLLKTGNQFNDWIVGKLFLGFEEIKSSEGKRDFIEIMKDSVTNARLATEAKGGKHDTSDNCANGFMLTNHRDACPIDDDERRWGIYFCAQQSFADLLRDGMDVPYFRRLYDWLNKGGFAIVSHFLATMPLQEALDPARGMQRAPETTSTEQAKGESLGLVEQEILDAVEGGLHGFRGDMITSIALKALFDRLRKTIAPRRYRQIMATVGYETHPALHVNNGRPNNPLSDGTRPRLYFRKKSPAFDLKEPVEISEFAERQITGAVAGSNVVPIRR
jgi:hypothetical protein